MKQKFLLFITALMLCVGAKGSTEQVINGLKYMIYTDWNRATLIRNNYTQSEITIPASITWEGKEYPVTKLGDGCFMYCYSLSKVIIPASVKSIGESCFYWCWNLTSITIPSSVTSIGRSCFYECWNLTSVNIPSSVTSLGDDCFSECSGLTSITIPSSVTSIGRSCFYGCWNLTSVNIPSSVTSLGSSCFSGCYRLTSVNIPSSVTSLGDDCFSGCHGLTSVNIPSSVTSLGSSCFSGCYGLTSVNIPSSVTSLGSSCFSGCSGLTSITIPSSVTSIGRSCFLDCSSLSDILLPDGITEIGQSCFKGCTSLKVVLVPFGVDKVENQTFEGCTSLERVRIGHGQIPTTIGSSVFSGCSSLKSVIPTSTITSFGSQCFKGCASLETIYIPENVTQIGDGCFTGCVNLKTVYAAPKEIYASKDENWHFKGELSAELLKPLVSCIIGTKGAVARTVCLKNKVLISKAPGHIHAYSVKGVGNGKVILSEVVNGVLEAGVAYIIRGANVIEGGSMLGTTFTLEEDEGPLVESTLLQGVCEDTYAPVGSYVLQPDGRFHLVTQTNTIKVGACHAYLNVPGGVDDAPALSVQFGGETTGIDGITEMKKEASPYLYDLTGRRVTTPQKGQIYIRGGKKVIY